MVILIDSGLRDLVGVLYDEKNHFEIISNFCISYDCISCSFCVV